MKKARIILTAITALAIVGGALAFKAKKFGQVLWGTTIATAQFCDVPFTLYTTTIPNAGGRWTTMWTTITPISKCSTFVFWDE